MTAIKTKGGADVADDCGGENRRPFPIHWRAFHGLVSTIFQPTLRELTTSQQGNEGNK